LEEATCRGNPAYLYGLDLFNHGYYWEAHEAWESQWHAAGRHGPAADFLKALIKLAAAGVKAREGRAAGVRQHAQRAERLLRGVQDAALPVRFGLSLRTLIAGAEKIAHSAESLAGDLRPDAARRLPLTLLLD
jgi:predicted metal-dependent hydrolase